MIYKDPFANAEAKEGKWFAWYPVQLDGENRTAWLCYVKREYIEAGGYGMYIYRRIV